jgi:hypothetical protein
MTKAILAACSISFLSILPARADDGPKVEAQPLHIGALQEFGYIVDGTYLAGTEKSRLVHQDWVDHFGAFLTKDVTVEDRLHLSAGLGGVFQFRKPETVGLGFAYHQRKAFFVGPTKAEAVYDIGENGNPWLQLGAGMFGYKYNPEAANLGEYLFRSGAYPTYNYTGGYVIANSTGASLEGFKALFRSGNFKGDLLLFTETGLAPMYDWSLAGVASYRVADGLLDVGAGFNFQRMIPVRPSRTANPAIGNSYFEVNGETFVGQKEFYGNPARFYAARADSLAAKDPAANAAAIADYRARASAFAAKAGIVDSVLTLDDSLRPQLKHYSASALMLMARATFDPKRIFPSDAFGAEDLKIYAEADILGVRNFPIYYKKITERMPIMFGINLPGFKLLDLIAIQGEYLRSPWLNDTYQRGRNAFNTPYLPDPMDANLSKNDYNDAAANDDFKWTVQLKKNLGRNVSLWGQAASDHLRMPSSSYFYGPQFDHNEVTALDKQWYWMAQISWGI